jgi:tripartite-type tricarboxylate transporter receptor subunit TctC
MDVGDMRLLQQLRRTRMITPTTVALAFAVALACLGSASAQDGGYPNRTVRIISGFAPGGGADTVARLFAERLTALLGQPVVVENRAGAAGGIAGRQVASAAPDGYTVLLTSNGMMINQIINPGLGLDIERDLTPVASVAPQAVIVVAAPELPANSLPDLIRLAKERSLNYGTPGAGSVSQLVVEYIFTTQSDARMTHIPYSGAAPTLTAAMANQIEIASTTMPPAVALVKSGKLKGIAITTPARSMALPQVPTVAEQMPQGMSVSVWSGFFVPAKTPQAIVARLEEAVLKIADMPDTKEKLAQFGYEPTSIAAEPFRRELANEFRMWTDVVAKTKLKP